MFTPSAKLRSKMPWDVYYLNSDAKFGKLYYSWNWNEATKKQQMVRLDRLRFIVPNFLGCQRGLQKYTSTKANLTRSDKELS